MESNNQRNGTRVWTGLSKLNKEQLTSLKHRIQSECKKPLHQERVFSVYPILADASFACVKHFDGKQAPNQWPNFMADIRLINDPSQADYAYFKALAEAIEPNNPLDSLDVIMLVSRVQNEQGKEPFSKDVFPGSLKDIKKVYLLDTMTDDEGEKSYIPVIRKQVV